MRCCGGLIHTREALKLVELIQGRAGGEQLGKWEQIGGAMGLEDLGILVILLCSLE